MLNRKSYEIVHCIGASSLLSLYAVALGKALGKTTVLEMTLLGSDDPLSMKENSRGRRAGLRLWLFKQADIVISKSPALSTAYLRSGLARDKLRQVANPVDTRVFSPATREARRMLREKLNLGGRPVILFVGSILERKGIDVLLDSFGAVVKSYPDSLLVLVGSTEVAAEGGLDFGRQMAAYAESLGIRQQVIFTGLVDNVEQYMKASDLFVFPSRREGLPNALLEAMASGLPVIARNIPGITDFVIDNERNGLLVDEDDAEGFCEAIGRLLNDQDLRGTLSKEARATIQTHFSIHVVDSQLQEVYAALLE